MQWGVKTYEFHKEMIYESSNDTNNWLETLGLTQPQAQGRPNRKRSKLNMDTRHTHSTTVARPMASRSPRSTNRPIEKPIDFVLNLPRQVQSVAVAGTFNHWDPRRTPMRNDPAGTWKTTIWLPKGRYEYRFVADGCWMSDPNAAESVPNPFGGTNSVRVV